ncbi:hypothetical protein NFI96_015105 [Prochilodus magdalenae]|nr:hypothetical protein NFI96_015105 [Prochilodus magdalenae]
MVEVSACTNITRRECRCKPGFYCPSATQISCRRTCQPCKAGTFSSEPSLTCRPYTDCAKDGKVVIAEGSPTQDRVCGLPTTTNYIPTPTTEDETTSPSTTPIPTSTFTTTTSAPTTTPTPTITPIAMAASKLVTVLSTIIPTPITDEPATLTPVPASSCHQLTSKEGKESISQPLHQTTHQGASTAATGYVTSETSEENIQLPGGGSVPPQSWTFILLLVVFLLLVLTCLSMKCKGSTLKDKLLEGVPFRKYVSSLYSSLRKTKEAFQVCFVVLLLIQHLQHLQKQQRADSSSVSTCHNVEMQIPLSRDTTNSASGQGMGPSLCPGGSQQVTMDYSGKGESINNTVGSIFIYSPGMVILGSNSNEKKDEGSENGERIPLMSVPQQESSLQPQDDSVGVGMQEEFGKELSFPVPATSK